MELDIRHDEQARKYTATRSGEQVGLLTYYPVGEGVIDFTHTYVPPEHRGQGIADQLVEHALDEMIGRGYRFRASCWFVDAYARRHASRYQQAFAHA